MEDHADRRQRAVKCTTAIILRTPWREMSRADGRQRERACRLRPARGSNAQGDLMRKLRLLIAAPLVLTACGSSETTDTPTWSPLVTKPWSLAPGAEKTDDFIIVPVERDIFVGGIRPLSPPGTHHTLVYRGNDIASANIIYASGVGTNELVFPPGTGLRLPAGSLIGLQLHIFNTTDASLAGESGVEVLEVDPANVVDEVDLVLAGPNDLALPPNQTSTQTGTCTATARQRVFALFPHMHQLGTHFKTTVTTGGTAQVIHDAAYSFDEQAFLSFEPMALEPGDTITTECTWNNTTGTTVTYGESTATEMCYSILLRYPSSITDDAFCDR